MPCRSHLLILSVTSPLTSPLTFLSPQQIARGRRRPRNFRYRLRCREEADLGSRPARGRLLSGRPELGVEAVLQVGKGHQIRPVHYG